MSYEMELIRKDQLQVSKWSGGTTTELAIFPKDAILPNINRIIMIIQGKLILEHEGHHRSILKPFNQDDFSGSWTNKNKDLD